MVFILRDILFYIKRTSKFFRETLRLLVEIFSVYIAKKGSRADIRVAYNGYSSGQHKDWLHTFVQKLTGQQVVASWYKPSLIVSSSFGTILEKKRCWRQSSNCIVMGNQEKNFCNNLFLQMVLLMKYTTISFD